MTQQNKCVKRAGMHRGDRGLGGLIFPFKIYDALKQLKTRNQTTYSSSMLERTILV